MDAPGIIPAYAGNTLPQTRNRTAHGDHPRVCGEHPLVDGEPSKYPGSSPRMRGTRGSIQIVHARTGIIPAYAGNTDKTDRMTEKLRDHPRVCGEHPYRIIPIPEDMGSSPRMRGTLSLVPVSASRSGIIPAYAGNTMSSDLTLKNLRDHPRVCGEHDVGRDERVELAGSSPRMRGTRVHRRLVRLKTGIIPAYAGNTA